VDAVAQLDLLDLYDLLLLARLVAALLLLVLELAEVEDLADGRIGVGRDFHEVEAGLRSLGERLVAGDDPQHVAPFVHQTNSWSEDVVVDARAFFGRWRG